MKNIDQFNFKDKKAIIRVDYNVPLDGNLNITDDNRIRASLPTIKKILSDGGSAILMSHLGRPKNGYEEKFSLKHLTDHLSHLLKRKVLFAENCIGAPAENMANNIQNGDVLLLENLRFHKEETKGDDNFARELSKLADLYINDAFGTAHRAHASTAIIANYFPEKKMFGYLMSAEIENLEKVLKSDEKPFTAILGGAKISGKIDVIEQLMEKASQIIIGGGMMFTFIKAMGGKIGDSLLEEDHIKTAEAIIKKAKDKNVGLFIPEDCVVADDFSNSAQTKIVSADAIPDGWKGMDIGPKARDSFSNEIKKSKMILWNGPMGVFEMEAFAKGTEAIAKALADATARGAYSLIGGGDSVSAIYKTGLAEKISYISTGGGAMLEYIEGKELPGIKAILS